MRYSILFLWPTQPATVFHVSPPKGVLHHHIIEMATLIVRDPTPAQGLKDRWGIYSSDDNVTFTPMEDVLGWLYKNFSGWLNNDGLPGRKTMPVDYTVCRDKGFPEGKTLSVSVAKSRVGTSESFYIRFPGGQS